MVGVVERASKLGCIGSPQQAPLIKTNEKFEVVKFLSLMPYVRFFVSNSTVTELFSEASSM
jgi:hypothetical protein